MRSLSQTKNGFALVIVLWVLAGLAVVAVSVASTASNSARSVKLLRDRVAAERAFISTGAHIAVLAATGVGQRNAFISEGGRLLVDGRMTKVSDHEWLQLQDGRGLLNLNRPDAKRLPKLLRHCGANEIQVTALSDALADYIDADQLKRINGAEAFEYRAAGLPEPRNAPLLSREELWRVYGFAAISKSWAIAGCDQLVTVHGDTALNRNTSPKELLLIDGTSEAATLAMIDAREQGLPDVAIQTQGDDPSNPYNFVSTGYVGKTLRVRHQMDSIQWTTEYELELTPQREGGPWRMHELRNPQKSPQAPKAGAVLPDIGFRLPERERTQLNAAPRPPFAN